MKPSSLHATIFFFLLRVPQAIGHHADAQARVQVRGQQRYHTWHSSAMRFIRAAIALHGPFDVWQRASPHHS